MIIIMIITIIMNPLDYNHNYNHIDYDDEGNGLY